MMKSPRHDTEFPAQGRRDPTRAGGTTNSSMSSNMRMTLRLGSGIRGLLQRCQPNSGPQAVAEGTWSSTLLRIRFCGWLKAETPQTAQQNRHSECSQDAAPCRETTGLSGDPGLGATAAAKQQQLVESAAGEVVDILLALFRRVDVLLTCMAKKGSWGHVFILSPYGHGSKARLAPSEYPNPH